MKTLTRNPAFSLRRLLRAVPLNDPRVRAAGCGAAALLLSAPGLDGRPLPMAAALLLALPPLPEGLCAFAGGALGSLLFWGWPGALEPLALSLLMLTAAALFRTELRAVSRLGPILAASLTALLGLVFLFDRGFSLPALVAYAAKPLLAAGTVLLCARLRSGQTPVRPRAASPAPPSGPALPLQELSGIFETLSRELSAPIPAAAQRSLADSYDAAAAQVCHLCSRQTQCWEERAQQTYEALCAAGGPILQRGCAVREDFPPEFRDACRHAEGFVTAVNQSLEAARSRHRVRSRLDEGRRVLAAQYLLLSRFLERLSAEPGQAPSQPRFAPEFAVSAACRPGSSVSGDRGASFRDRFGNFYVLLCDGMGSGPEASRESERAVRTLRGLLEAGVTPDAATALLNGFYALRGDGVFATVDLLRLSLASGEGVLYKWGAAPSYLKRGERVETLGTASPPPGLGADSETAPCQRELSLGGGETLIMVSDGAFCPQTAQRAARLPELSCRELTAALISALREQSEDDMTAVAVRLKAS